MKAIAIALWLPIVSSCSGKVTPLGGRDGTGTARDCVDAGDVVALWRDQSGAAEPCALTFFKQQKPDADDVAIDLLETDPSKAYLFVTAHETKLGLGDSVIHAYAIAGLTELDDPRMAKRFYARRDSYPADELAILYFDKITETPSESADVLARAFVERLEAPSPDTSVEMRPSYREAVAAMFARYGDPQVAEGLCSPLATMRQHEAIECYLSTTAAKRAPSQKASINVLEALRSIRALNVEYLRRVSAGGFSVGLEISIGAHCDQGNPFKLDVNFLSNPSNEPQPDPGILVRMGESAEGEVSQCLFQEAARACYLRLGNEQGCTADGAFARLAASLSDPDLRTFVRKFYSAKADNALALAAPRVALGLHIVLGSKLPADGRREEGRDFHRRKATEIWELIHEGDPFPAADYFPK